MRFSPSPQFILRKTKPILRIGYQTIPAGTCGEQLYREPGLVRNSNSYDGGGSGNQKSVLAIVGAWLHSYATGHSHEGISRATPYLPPPCIARRWWWCTDSSIQSSLSHWGRWGGKRRAEQGRRNLHCQSWIPTQLLLGGQAVGSNGWVVGTRGKG